MAESSASSSPLAQPASPGQQDDDALPGAALMDMRILELQREQGHTRFFFPQDPLAAQAKPEDEDTFVLIEFPASSSIRCDGTKWSHVQLRMSAEKLLSTGSAVFKEKLVEVTPQMRKRRRQDHTGLVLPESIKYILDLTPPDMGDELAALVTILSVPESVRAWWQSGSRLNIKRSLVSGHDDACIDHAHVPEDCNPGGSQAKQQPSFQDQLPIVDLDDIVGPVPSRQVPDYCPIRHRATIIFIMEAILSDNSKSVLECLNSAIRVYTAVKLAKSLDCMHVVTDSVYTWALGHPSGNFIELLPEVSLELFWDLKVAEVVRGTFAILTVEGALELLGVPTDPSSNGAVTFNAHRVGPTTIFGRKRDALPDDIANAIQHARDGLVERTRVTLSQLRSDAVFDFLSLKDMASKSIPEWNQLSDIGETLGCTVPGRSAHVTVNPPVPVLTAYTEDQQIRLQGLRTAYNGLASALVEYFHSRLMESFTGIDCNFAPVDRDRKCYVPRSQFTCTSEIYKQLNEEQRLLTVYPWYKLRIKAEVDTKDDFFFQPIRGGSTLAQLAMVFDQYLLNSMTLFSELAPYYKRRSGGGMAFFRLETFREEYVEAMKSMYEKRKVSDVEFLTRSQHLALGSAEEELRYLPMWAGGYDDELGGIYDSNFVPNSENGPSGPGPAFHTAGSVPTEVSTIAPSTPTMCGTTTTDDDDDDAVTEGSLARGGRFLVQRFDSGSRPASGHH
ncbi:hypothetical protein PG985_003998 [Apiospora marii]|uniref:uncharacterized protein n=1 Tax=Apiospora marii TaxID=335849 RepID=UPI003130FFF1